jgi:hypothetical protein
MSVRRVHTRFMSRRSCGCVSDSVKQGRLPLVPAVRVACAVRAVVYTAHVLCVLCVLCVVLRAVPLLCGAHRGSCSVGKAAATCVGSGSRKQTGRSTVSRGTAAPSQQATQPTRVEANMLDRAGVTRSPCARTGWSRPQVSHQWCA